MREVAALAGVSLKTVSRVVNDEPGVSAAVHERVTLAIRHLDFRPNLAASSLRRTGGRTGLVGALVEDLSSSFSTGLLRALEDAARLRGTAVLAASLDEAADRERELVHDLVTRRVDGLVIMPATDRQDYLASELHTGTPAVFVGREPRGVAADSVTVDDERGARQAGEHLLARGHRRVAGFFHRPAIPSVRGRISGFEAAHAERGLPLDPALVVTDLAGTQDAAEAAHLLLGLADPPTAVLAGRDVLAAGVLRALAERGLRRSVAVVGLDDLPMADLLDPPLTVVRQDVASIGETAAALLFHRIDGDTSPPRHVVLGTTLVPRGSGEIPPPAG